MISMDYCLLLLLKISAIVTMINADIPIDWSSWSSCSNSCNGGVMSRSCLHCSQATNVQYMSCNNQDCSAGMLDTRDQQCKDVSKKFLTFAKYSFKAKRNGRVGELCELFCEDKTGSIQVNPPIKDGTPCVTDDGKDGQCLGTLCAPIGCSGVLGSNYNKDKCHRCVENFAGGLDQQCNNFENVLNTNNNNHVVSFIPINSMSIKITYKHQIDILTLTHSVRFPGNATVINLDGNIFTVKENDTIFAAGPLTQALTIKLQARDDIKPSVSFEYHLLVPIDNEESILISNATFEWNYGEFTSCSVSCGGGIQVSHAHCIDTAFPDKVMPDKFCLHTTKPLPIVRKCSKGDCPARWVAGNWGVCPSKCGNGTKYRDVRCWRVKQDGSDFYVDSDHCNGLDKPVTSELCNVKPCGTHWKTSDWSVCSQRCGLGIQNRTVYCADENDQIVDELFCLEDGNIPASIRPCDNVPCHFTWYTSSWSKCSVQCGEGVKSRTVYCSDQNSIPMNDYKCANLTKPSTQQSCYEVTGCFSAWIESSWKPCHGPCGHAHQTRDVDCYVFVGDEIVNIPDMCDNETRPDTKRLCPEDQCSKWISGEWGMCNEKCMQNRTVTCMKGNNFSNECDNTKKPNDSKSCDGGDCPPCKDKKGTNCGYMKTTFSCSNGFVKQSCCMTCSQL